MCHAAPLRGHRRDTPREIVSLVGSGTAAPVLKDVMPFAKAHGVELGFETDLPGTDYTDFPDQIDHPCARAYHDRGHTTAMGGPPPTS